LHSVDDLDNLEDFASISKLLPSCGGFFQNCKDITKIKEFNENYLIV
jgi:hypothetical protein